MIQMTEDRSLKTEKMIITMYIWPLASGLCRLNSVLWF
jgi:hypothetical protein